MRRALEADRRSEQRVVSGERVRLGIALLNPRLSWFGWRTHVFASWRIRHIHKDYSRRRRFPVETPNRGWRYYTAMRKFVVAPLFGSDFRPIPAS